MSSHLVVCILMLTSSILAKTPFPLTYSSTEETITLSWNDNLIFEHFHLIGNILELNSTYIRHGVNISSGYELGQQNSGQSVEIFINATIGTEIYEGAIVAKTELTSANNIQVISYYSNNLTFKFEMPLFAYFDQIEVACMLSDDTELYRKLFPNNVRTVYCENVPQSKEILITLKTLKNNFSPKISQNFSFTTFENPTDSIECANININFVQDGVVFSWNIPSGNFDMFKIQIDPSLDSQPMFYENTIAFTKFENLNEYESYTFEISTITNNVTSSKECLLNFNTTFFCKNNLMDVTMEVKDKSYLNSISIEITVNNFVISKESKFGIIVGTHRQCVDNDNITLNGAFDKSCYVALLFGREYLATFNDGPFKIRLGADSSCTKNPCNNLLAANTIYTAKLRDLGKCGRLNDGLFNTAVEIYIKDPFPITAAILGTVFGGVFLVISSVIFVIIYKKKRTNGLKYAL